VNIMTKSRPIRILYMEDDPGLARLFQKKLERAGYIVDIASDGEEGLAMCAAGDYDVLAVDQAMPVHDGLEVIRTLASQGPLPPTIMVTGTGSEKIAVEAMKSGAGDYVVKDVDGGYLDLLPTVIEHVLQQQHLAEEKQWAELKLQEAERRFRTLLDNVRLVAVGLDQEGNVAYANPHLLELTGYTPDEALGKNWFQTFIPERDRPAVGTVFSEILETGLHPHYENPILTRDGEERLIAWNNTVLLDENGKPVGTTSIGEDITEQARAEEERERLLAAEHEQRLLAETLREVTLALASQTSHEAVLDEILRQAQHIVPHSTANIALLEDDTLRTVHWRGYQVPGWKELVSDLVQPMADWSLDAQVVRSRNPLVVPDTHQEPGWVVLDETAWIRSYLSVPLCLRDRVLGLLRLDGDLPGQFSAEDAQRLQPLASAAAIAIENARLVEGLEAEVAARTAEIRAEQEKSEAILRSVGDAIVMFGLEKQIQYVNEAFTALTGYTAEEALGQQASLLMGEGMSEQDQQSLQLALAKGEVWQGEVTHRRKDGRTYDAALTIAPMHDADGNLAGYVSSHQDISRLKDLDRARSRFMTNVSHELRTPVTTLKTTVYLLRKGGQPKKTKVYLQMMEKETARLTHLIQDILEMTALDSGQAVTIWEPVPLSRIIENTITRYQSRAEASGLTLAVRPIPHDLPVVQGDQARLSQVLGEVVENAIIFTPAGGRVTVEAEAVEDEGQLWVTVAVRDTGPGISPEEQERVFDRFYRGSLAKSGHIPGTGLGLSITDEILRAHGGRVTVESPSTMLPSAALGTGTATSTRGGKAGEVGGGSTFTLWLRSTPDVEGENHA